jgi:hypothetical protein
MVDTTSSDEFSFEVNQPIRDKERKKLARSAKALGKTWSTWSEESDRTEEDFDWVDEYLTSKGYITMPLVQPTDWASKRKRINGLINGLLTSGANPGLDEAVNDLRLMRGAWRAKKSYNTTRKRQIRLVLTKEDRTLLKEIGGTLAGRATFKKQIMLCLGKYKAIENDISKKNAEIGQLHEQLESLKLELRDVRSSHEQLSIDNNELKEKLTGIHKVNEQLSTPPHSSPDSEPDSDEAKPPIDRASSYKELSELRAFKMQAEELLERLQKTLPKALALANSFPKNHEEKHTTAEQIEEWGTLTFEVRKLLRNTHNEPVNGLLKDLLSYQAGHAQFYMIFQHLERILPNGRDPYKAEYQLTRDRFMDMIEKLTETYGPSV